MNKSNYILLGVAISYILIAIIQIRVDGLLPASLYVTVAFVSLEFTVFEMLKSMINSSIHSLQRINMIAKSRTDFIERSIKTYDRFNVLNNETKWLKDELKMLPNNDNLAKNNKKIKYLRKLFSIMSCIQIIICTIQIMITPFKFIPYDKLTNKVINVVTLFSFAFMFLSYFFSNFWDGDDAFQEERWHVYETTCSDYLKILEKVASDNENK